MIQPIVQLIVQPHGPGFYWKTRACGNETLKEYYVLYFMYADVRKRQGFQLYCGLYYGLYYGCTMVVLLVSPHNNAVAVPLMPAGLHVPTA